VFKTINIVFIFLTFLIADKTWALEMTEENGSAAVTGANDVISERSPEPVITRTKTALTEVICAFITVSKHGQNCELSEPVTGGILLTRQSKTERISATVSNKIKSIESPQIL
jgi:hypothetical protein